MSHKNFPMHQGTRVRMERKARRELLQSTAVKTSTEPAFKIVEKPVDKGRPKVRMQKPPFPWIIFVGSHDPRVPSGIHAVRDVQKVLDAWAAERHKANKIHVQRISFCQGKIRFVGGSTPQNEFDGFMLYGTSEHYGLKEGLLMIQDLGAFFARAFGQASAEIHFAGDVTQVVLTQPLKLMSLTVTYGKNP